MDRIQFVTDDKGRMTAVLIDLTNGSRARLIIASTNFSFGVEVA
jgi:hypothetical protein